MGRQADDGQTDPLPKNGPRSPPSKDAKMRAEIETMTSEIKQSLELLRRHL
jgi:hypothetical protein